MERGRTVYGHKCSAWGGSPWVRNPGKSRPTRTSSSGPSIRHLHRQLHLQIGQYGRLAPGPHGTPSGYPGRRGRFAPYAPPATGLPPRGTGPDSGVVDGHKWSVGGRGLTGPSTSLGILHQVRAGGPAWAHPQGELDRTTRYSHCRFRLQRGTSGWTCSRTLCDTPCSGHALFGNLHQGRTSGPTLGPHVAPSNHSQSPGLSHPHSVRWTAHLQAFSALTRTPTPISLPAPQQQHTFHHLLGQAPKAHPPGVHYTTSRHSYPNHPTRPLHW
jgi:hypothetical protein